jgi:hypothetical protein
MGLAWDQAAAAARGEVLLSAHMCACHEAAARARAAERGTAARREAAACAAFRAESREALGARAPRRFSPILTKTCGCLAGLS